MKHIPNQQTNIPLHPKPGHATFADLIRDSLDFPPASGGFTPAVMRARDRVEKALADVEPGGVIDLEDADFETAKRALADTGWRIRSPFLIALFDLFGL
jgi:hypothetical protein